jgi:hypothetical protein
MDAHAPNKTIARFSPIFDAVDLPIYMQRQRGRDYASTWARLRNCETCTMQNRANASKFQDRCFVSGHPAALAIGEKLFYRVIDIGCELREQPLDNGDSVMLAFHASAVSRGRIKILNRDGVKESACEWLPTPSPPHPL